MRIRINGGVKLSSLQMVGDSQFQVILCSTFHALPDGTDHSHGRLPNLEGTMPKLQNVQPHNSLTDGNPEEFQYFEMLNSMRPTYSIYKSSIRGNAVTFELSS